MEFLYLFTGLGLGFLMAWLLLRSKTPQQASDPARAQELEKQVVALKTQLDTQQTERRRLEEEKQKERAEFQQQQEKERNESQKIREQERAQLTLLSEKLAARNAEYTALEQRLNDQKQELENLQKRFAVEFENLANKIFEEKSKKFTEQNRSNLDDLLKPLGERIKDFEQKVNDVYVNETRERVSLKEQIVQLHHLNQQMSKDAQNLTRALRGEAKTQGSWGEFILESVLEKSGLLRDREFTVQTTFIDPEGRRLQPDVIVNLPENKHLVIDSKVTLVAYERYCSGQNDAERIAFLKEHIDAIRKHVRQLSEKRYHELYDINSPDFVLMFIPNEPAFHVAIQSESGLFLDAMERNIMLVTPTTLLVTLRMIANVWRQEHQNRNVIQIADEAGAMYEKFVGFIEAMIDVGLKLDASKKQYEVAMSRFHRGPGNVIRKLEQLKALGLKVNKSLPPKLVEKANEEDPGENELP